MPILRRILLNIWCFIVFFNKLQEEYATLDCSDICWFSTLTVQGKYNIETSTNPSWKGSVTATEDKRILSPFSGSIFALHSQQQKKNTNTNNETYYTRNAKTAALMIWVHLAS